MSKHDVENFGCLVTICLFAATIATFTAVFSAVQRHNREIDDLKARVEAIEAEAAR